jgi:amidophosphoribosyltransferase
MCGIVGVLAHGAFETKKEENIRQEAMIYLTTELLQLTQARGKDATGVATLFEDGDYMGLKMGVSAQEFVTRFGEKETDYEGFLNVWRKKVRPARIVIGHCRKPSTLVGAGTEDNNNNHPIKVGDIVGLHNGTLTNHDKIFENLKCGRDSKVDSEAIFRLLDHLTNKGTEPFSMPVLQETCRRLGGTYSVLTFNGNNPFQLAGFRDGRPMEFALIKPLKLFLIASEKDYIKIAITRYNKMAYLYQLGRQKFPGLKKSDIEFGTTIDDSIYLFDVTQEVTPETKLVNLYQTEKIPRNNKLWGKTTATNNWQNNRNQGRAAGGAAATTGAGAAGAKKTEVNAGKPSAGAATPQGQQQSSTQTATSTGKGSTDKAHRLGMAWNRTSNQFEDVTTAKKTATDHKSVLIDIEDGGIVDIDSGNVLKAAEKKTDNPTSSNGSPATRQQSDSQQDFSLEESTKPVDTLVCDSAKIIVADVADVNNAGDGAASTGDGGGVYAIHKGGRTIVPTKEVDVTTHTDVFEKSLVAAQDQENFSTDDELADALDILDVSAMYQMARYSLANRIKKFFFQKGWYLGYLACKAEMAANKVVVKKDSTDEYARNMLSRAVKRARAASATIRNMKNLIGLLEVGMDTDVTSVRRDLTKAVNDAVIDGVELNAEALEKAFKPGDLRKSPMLAHVINSVKEIKA